MSKSPGQEETATSGKAHEAVRFALAVLHDPGCLRTGVSTSGLQSSSVLAPGSTLAALPPLPYSHPFSPAP